MRTLVLVSLLLAACGQQQAQPTAAVAADLQPCAEFDGTRNGLTPGQCLLQSSGQTLRVTHADVAAGMEAGATSVDVLGEDGEIVQTLLETNVDEYLTPQLEDVDGDGRADILIPRVLGNVNYEWGVWIYDGARYRRVGEISGVEVERTADGLIAVPARSSCCSWNVRYYRLGENGLSHLVTAQIDGEEMDDGSVRGACTMSESPGLAQLNLNARAAQERFCAEPASQVFGP